MALDPAALKAAIKTAFQNAVGTDDDFDSVAGDIADAVDTFVQGGDVDGTAGGDPLLNGAMT